MIPCVDSESRRNPDGAEYISYTVVTLTETVNSVSWPLPTQRLWEKLTIAIAMLTISEKKRAVINR